MPSLSAQGFNADKKELSDFLTRMYKSEPFEGVRVVTDYENTYLLSVLSLDKSKYPNESVLNRVAGVKAMSEASRYFNGSSISSEMIIRTKEAPDGTSDTWILEDIREHSVGYVKQLEQLTNFTGSNGRQVFIFYKQIESSPKD
ncbi:MAG: hypothetical protein IKH24_03895 [Bacteroidales bacterium]|nr:hypothetical protein [Bacteroidales bacterium]